MGNNIRGALSTVCYRGPRTLWVREPSGPPPVYLVLPSVISGSVLAPLTKVGSWPAET